MSVRSATGSVVDGETNMTDASNSDGGATNGTNTDENGQ